MNITAQVITPCMYARIPVYQGKYQERQNSIWQHIVLEMAFEVCNPYHINAQLNTGGPFMYLAVPDHVHCAAKELVEELRGVGFEVPEQAQWHYFEHLEIFGEEDDGGEKWQFFVVETDAQRRWDMGYCLIAEDGPIYAVGDSPDSVLTNVYETWGDFNFKDDRLSAIYPVDPEKRKETLFLLPIAPDMYEEFYKTGLNALYKVTFKDDYQVVEKMEIAEL